MLMKTKSTSKSQPKFFARDNTLTQPRLHFNDNKVPRPNVLSKKYLKATDVGDKENSLRTDLRNKQPSPYKFNLEKRNPREEPEVNEDNQQEREKRRREFESMNERVRVLEDKLNQIKSVIETNAEKRNKYKINQEGKVNPLDKDSVNSINSFVTQMKIPLQVVPHCSSERNLLSTKQPLKFNSHKYYISTVMGAFNSRANTTFMQLCKTHLATSLHLLKTLKTSYKPSDVQPIRSLKPTKRNTIIFDLDQTLIHCNDNITMPYDTLLELNFPGGDIVKAGINVRARASETLRILSSHFEIMVFTASHECYGSVVCDYLDPTNSYISQRYFRDSCFKTKQGYYVKDLRVIDRPLSKMLLIDNAAYSYVFQVENGVPIVPFYDCKTDMELKHLVQYLMGFVESEDVRVDHCQRMKVDEYGRFDSPQELIGELYADMK